MAAPFLDLWRYRELFYVLVWRDITTRYKQTTVGIAWAIIQPFITMIVFSFLFGTLVKIETGSIPYPIFVYTGLLFWTFFSRSITTASESIIANRNIVNNVYFPRLLLPIAASVVNLVDFFFSLFVLILLMVYFQFIPQLLGVFFIPVALMCILFLAVGIGSVIASLNVKYRDVRFIVPYALQVALLLTPVLYPLSLAEEKYTFLFFLNPMTNILETIRALLFGIEISIIIPMGLSLIGSIIIFFAGTTYFNQTEKYFSDSL